jgi:hypothetical protein
MAITSMRVVLLRLVIDRLNDRGVAIHRRAELARVPVPDIWRLVEFASPPAEAEQKRLLEVGLRLLAGPKPALAKPQVRLGDWSRSSENWIAPVAGWSSCLSS